MNSTPHGPQDKLSVGSVALSAVENLPVSASAHFYVGQFAHLKQWRDYLSAVSFPSVSLFLVGFYLSVRLGEHAYGTLNVSSPFWLPGAVLLSALLLAQKQHWPIIAVVVLSVRLTAGAPPGTPHWFLLFSSADDLMASSFSAWLLLRVLRHQVRLDTLSEFMIFLGVAAGVGPALSAVIATPGRYVLGDTATGAAYRWFLGNSLAQVIVTPTVLFWYTAAWKRLYPPLKELLVLCGGLMGVSLYAFHFSVGLYSPILLYLPVPFIVWAALRLGPIGTATAISLLAPAAMLNAVEGVGLFSKGSPSQDVLSLQLFLLVVSIPLLSLSVVIDERKRAGETLRESEEKFRRLFRDAAVGMVIVSPEGRFLRANGSFCKSVGYTEEDLLQKTVQSLTHPEDWPAFSRQLSQALRQGTDFPAVENRCLHKSGRVVCTESSTTLIRGACGEPQYFVGAVLDVTERKQAEEALRGLNQRLIQAQEQEAARIARELHDDVTQRLALLSVTLGGLTQQASALTPDFGQMIDKASKQAGDLADDVQAISHRIHSSKLEYLGLEKAAAGFCREFSDRQRVEIAFHAQNIRKELSQEISTCLFRTLQESLQNAAKHSRSKCFEVSIRGASDRIELAVHDSGIGFVPEEAMKGRGLGLTSIAERLRLVSGNLLIDSQPRHGTTIHAQVPLNPE